MSSRVRRVMALAASVATVGFVGGSASAHIISYDIGSYMSGQDIGFNNAVTTYTNKYFHFSFTVDESSFFYSTNPPADLATGSCAFAGAIVAGGNLSFSCSGPQPGVYSETLDISLPVIAGLNHFPIAFNEFTGVDGTASDDVVSHGGSYSRKGSAFIEGITVDGTSVAAVPEPVSWGLMITGFGLVGASMRRRRSLAWSG